MATVVIGGQSKDIGKTGVVCALIAAMPERRWTAIKISRHRAGDSPPPPSFVSIAEEHDPTTGTDSSRYLAAGAVRSLWVRTADGALAETMPDILGTISGAKNVILESNSILDCLEPDLYAIVLDPRIADFKPSARRHLDRADAILLCGGPVEQANWIGVSLKLIEHTPQFHIAPPNYHSVEFISFVAQRLERLGR